MKGRGSCFMRFSRSVRVRSALSEVYRLHIQIFLLLLDVILIAIALLCEK